MGEFHNGSTTAIKTVGVKVETRLVAAEEKIKREEHRRDAFLETGAKVKKIIQDLRLDVNRSKIQPPFATEVDKWLRRVGDEIFALVQNSETEINRQTGIRDALSETVHSLKKMFDDIERRAKDIDEWEARPNKTVEDLKERPVGAEIEPGILQGNHKPPPGDAPESNEKPKKASRRKPRNDVENKLEVPGEKKTRRRRKKKEESSVTTPDSSEPIETPE